jgi:long-chain acyl-CoA synthetase
VARARIESKPDLIRGEIVKAFIQRRPDAALDDKEIMKHCRTYLSSYKVPREVEFVNAIEEKDD